MSMTSLYSNRFQRSPLEHLWDVLEWENKIKMSEKCFQHIVEFVAQRIKEVLRDKGGLTRYDQGEPEKESGECSLNEAVR